MVPIVYHPNYNVTAFGLERLHPFDSRKYRRIHDALIARGLLRATTPGQPGRSAESPRARVLGFTPQPGDPGGNPRSAGRPTPSGLAAELASPFPESLRHLVVSTVRERAIPVAMVLSGGYSTESWRIHTDAIESILTRFDRDA